MTFWYFLTDRDFPTYIMSESFPSQPTKAGTYCVKAWVYNTDKNNYWKYIPDSDCWIQLTAVEESDKPSNIPTRPLIKISQWNIAPVAGDSDIFTISPVYDKDGPCLFHWPTEGLWFLLKGN